MAKAKKNQAKCFWLAQGALGKAPDRVEPVKSFADSLSRPCHDLLSRTLVQFVRMLEVRNPNIKSMREHLLKSALQLGLFLATPVRAS